MEPISRDKHTRAQNKSHIRGQAINVVLSVLLHFGLLPAFGGKAFAASETSEGTVAQPADAADSLREGPENSFRYVDGVLADSEQGDALGAAARATGLVSTPSWNSSLGYNKYVYYNAKGVAIEH